MRGYIAGEGEFENDGHEPRGPLEKAQKIFEKFLKTIFFGGYIAGEGEFENDGREPRVRGKGHQKFLENFLENKNVFERLCSRRRGIRKWCA